MYIYNCKYVYIYIHIYIGQRPEVPRRRTGEETAGKVRRCIFTAFSNRFCSCSMLYGLISFVFLRGRFSFSSAQDENFVHMSFGEA